VYITLTELGIADAVWDELTIGHDSGFAQLIKDIETYVDKIDDAIDGLSAIKAEVEGLAGSAMIGTNNAALASVCTDARLGELDAGNIPGDIDTLKTYCDKIDHATDGLSAIKAEVEGLAGSAMIGTNNAALASVCTELRLAELDAANIPAVVDKILENQKEDWSWDCLDSAEWKSIAGTWATVTNTSQYFGEYLGNQGALNSEIAIPFYARSTAAITLNLRGITGNTFGILTVYVDENSQGTIDWYATFPPSENFNQIRTISITPARIGRNVLRLKMTTKHGDSSGYVLKISEMWLS